MLATFYAGDDSCSDSKKVIKYASYKTNLPKTSDAYVECAWRGLPMPQSGVAWKFSTCTGSGDGAKFTVSYYELIEDASYSSKLSSC